MSPAAVNGGRPTDPTREIKVTAAAGGALLSSATITPLVLYAMVRLLGEDPLDPLVLAAASAIAAVVVALVTAWAGWQRRSATSSSSDGYDPLLADRLHAERRRQLEERMQPRSYHDRGQGL